ncbi:MAG: hypothetical protein WD358_01530 [Nitriliruptoraceae bacterium]
MSRSEFEAALGRGDLDELVGAVDLLAARQEWDTLVWLRDRCHAAAEETGRQLWGVAHFADYRIALDADAQLAASVVVPGAGRFALGPLSEVVAQHHHFDELADDLDATVRGVVAQERIMRGEDLVDDERAGVDETGLPGRLEPWEPRYLVPMFRPFDRLDGGGGDTAVDSHATHGEQPDGALGPDVATVSPGEGAGPDGHQAADIPSGWIDAEVASNDLRRALVDLTEPWVSQSDGQATVIVGDRRLDDVLADIDDEPRHTTRVDVATAMRQMAFAAASGGVHGRRRGAAAGRAAAWWVAACATGLGFAPDPDELEFRLESLRWSVISRPSGAVAWHLGLALEDPDAGWVAIIDAYDRVPDDDHDEMT